MNNSVKENIKNTFASNPTAQVFYHDAAGHCFSAPAEGLTMITLEQAKALEPGDDAEAGEKAKYKVTAADLKKYPELAEQGINENDEVELPEGFAVDKKGKLVKA